MKSKLEIILGASIAGGSMGVIRGFQAVFKSISEKAELAARKLRELEKTSVKKTFEAGTKAGRAFASIMSLATEDMKKFGASTSKAVEQTNKLASSMSKAGGVAKGAKLVPPIPVKVVQQMKTAKLAAAEFDKGLGEVGEKAKKTNKLMVLLGASVSAVAAKFKSFVAYAISAGIFAGLALSVLAAQQAIFDYDQALHDLQAITQATDEETARMGETIKEVAATTKFSTVEIADGMRTLGQAGFTAEETIRGIKGISDLATGTLTDMSQSVDLVSTAIRVFNMDASRATEVSDVFANAVNGSKLTMDKLRVAFNYIGPIAKLAGVEFKELTSTMMLLANKGIRASTIGTGLRQVLNKILKPTEAFTEAVAAAGLTMDDLNPKTNDMRDVIGRLSLVVQNADQAFKMFGMRGAAAVSALVEGGAAQFDEMRSLVDRTGIAAKMAGEQLKGLSLRLKQLSDKVSVFFAELRDQGLGEPFGWIIDGGRYAMDVMILFAQNGLVPTIKVIGALVVALAAVKFAIWARSVEGSILIFQKFYNTAFLAGKAVDYLALSLRRATIALRTFLVNLGPVGWAILAVGVAITTVTYSFRKYSERLQEIIKQSEKTMSAMSRLQEVILKARVGLVGILEGTDKYKEGLVRLQDEIESTVKEFPQLREQADLAIASMDTLNGKFIDGQKALKDFEAALSDVQFEAATERVKAFDASLESSLFWQFVVGKLKATGKGLAKQLWEGSSIGGFFKLADTAVDKFSKKYSSMVDLVASKVLSIDSLSFEAMEEAAKGGGKALEDFSDLLKVGKQYVQDWAKETGIAFERLSPEVIETLSYELQEALDVSERMRKSMVKGATDIAEAFKKQGISGRITKWSEDFNAVGDSVLGLRYKLTQQGDLFEPIKKALGSVMGESDWTKLFNFDIQKTRISNELKEVEKLYENHVIDYKEYVRRKFEIGQRFNEVDRQMKTDEKFQTLQQFASLARARESELENLKIYADRYSKEQQEMMRLEIDDKYLTKSVDLLYKLDEKRKEAADKYAETEKELKEELTDSWEGYYKDMKEMAAELARKRADLVEEYGQKVLDITISLNRKLRDLKAKSLKEEVSQAHASVDIAADLSSAKKALARGDAKSAVAFAKNAQRAIKALGDSSEAEHYARRISAIYRKSGEEIHSHQVDLQNAVRAVRDKEVIAYELDIKARHELDRDLSRARRSLIAGDAEAAAKYAKSAEVSLKDVKNINVAKRYIKELQHYQKKAEEAMLQDKQIALTNEYDKKRIARKKDLQETLADTELLMNAAKEKYDEETVFLDQTLRLQKRNTAESLKGVKAQISMYEAARKTNEELSKKPAGGSVKGYSAGGEVFARPTDPHITAGSGFTDDVPALLKRNEFVFRPEATEHWGVSLLRRMNSGLTGLKNLTVPRFSSGGLVTAGADADWGGSGSSVSVSLNLPVPGRAIQTKMSPMNATELIRQLKGLEKMGS